MTPAKKAKLRTVARLLLAKRAGLVAHGNCLDLLRLLPDESVDSMVTDPPAGIAFMGKEWDTPNVSNYHVYSGAAGNAPRIGQHKGNRKEHLRARGVFVSHMTSVMEECLRVLKPGGYALVWAIPRTSHWTMTAIEEAGFEIRDVVSHLFGCLSEDTELLTLDKGWVQYQRIERGDLALCYDNETTAYSWQAVENLFVYPYSDTAYRISGEKTDQIVSKGHRCLVEQDGRTVFRESEALQRQEGVPVLEDVQSLLDAVPLPNGHTGGKKHHLRRELCQESHFPKESRSAEPEEDTAGRNEMPRVRKHTFQSSVASQTDSSWQREDVLQPFLPGKMVFGQQRYGRDRTPGEIRVDGEKPRKLSAENDRLQQSSLEGRSNLLQEEGELREHQVYSMSERVPPYGEEGQVRHGAQTSRCAEVRSVSDEIGICASRGSRSNQQFDLEPVSLRNQQRPQTVRASRFTSTDLAEVSEIRYEGKVWCVKTPTGAFVARRNGKAFVTGNSGFPKSLNVSKALDKAGGVRKSIVSLKRSLIEHFKESGLSKKEVDLKCGFRASNYLTLPREGKKPDPWCYTLPSEIKWKKIKQVLCVEDSKLDAAFAQAQREVIGQRPVVRGVGFTSDGPSEIDITLPATDAALQWEGWGTALKPAAEFWILARKPLIGSVAANVLEHGTGGLNIDGCRIGTRGGSEIPSGVTRRNADLQKAGYRPNSYQHHQPEAPKPAGRWPANLVLSHIASAWWCLKCQNEVGERRTKAGKEGRTCPNCNHVHRKATLPGETKCVDCGERFEVYRETVGPEPCSCGSTSAVFVPGCRQIGHKKIRSSHVNKPHAKPHLRSTSFLKQAARGYGAERADTEFRGIADPDGKETVEAWECADGCPVRMLDEQSGTLSSTGKRSNRSKSAVVAGTAWGVNNHQSVEYPGDKGGASRFFYCAKPSKREKTAGLEDRNHHPTVKGVDLMRWLIRLITPSGGLVLDPFSGSGTTGIAAHLEGMVFLGMEQDASYVDLANQRISHWREEAEEEQHVGMRRRFG